MLKPRFYLFTALLQRGTWAWEREVGGKHLEDPGQLLIATGVSSLQD